MSTYFETLASLPGVTQIHPLANDPTGIKPVIGNVATVSKSGVTFDGTRANFNGTGSINFGDSPDFSAVTTGELTIAIAVAIADWRGKGATEYVHWLAKGNAATGHEWAFRHYVQGGTGEAPQRQGRISYYDFNKAGGLGAGSYYQDGTLPTRERLIVATTNIAQNRIRLFVDGVQRDEDTLSGYNIKPTDTTSPVILGTRGDGTGFLVGSARRLSFAGKEWTPAQVAALNKAHLAVDPPPAPVDPLAAYLSTGGVIDPARYDAFVRAVAAKGGL